MSTSVVVGLVVGVVVAGERVVWFSIGDEDIRSAVTKSQFGAW